MKLLLGATLPRRDEGVNERNSKVGFEASELSVGGLIPSEVLKNVIPRLDLRHLQSATKMKQGLLHDHRPCFIFVAILQWGF